MAYYLLMIGVNQLITVGTYLLENKTSFGTLHFSLRQFIIGVVFGIFGCVATGLVSMVQVPLINVKDSFPITAGLLFGGRAGIISGLICGAYRFFLPGLAAADYTRISCSVTVIFAGIGAALMRNYFFKKKTPTLCLTFLFVISIEAFHMSMIFLTHIFDLAGAFALVKAACFKVMIANSLSVVLSVFVYRFPKDYFPKIKTKVKAKDIRLLKYKIKKEKKTISRGLSFSIIFCLIFAFFLMGAFLFAIHTSFTRSTLNKVFQESLVEIKDNITSGVENKDNITKDFILDKLYNYEDYMVDEVLLLDSGNCNILGSDRGFFPLKKDSVPEKLYMSNFENHYVYYMYERFHDFYITVVVDKNSIMFFRDLTVYMIVLLNIIVFSILFFSSYVLLKTNIISNMRKIIEAMIKTKNNDEEPETSQFMSISNELNYTFKLLYEQYDELSGQMQKEHENKEKFEYMAEHDKLTGILNREGFKRRICSFTGGKNKLAFLFIDVDKFKGINDTYGHIIGDKLLNKVAKNVKEDSRVGDIFMRYGGDEFALVMIGCSSKDKDIIVQKINIINNRLKNPDDGLPPVTISVGAAFSERGYNKEVMAEADKALYVMKEKGRAGCFCSDFIIK